MGGPLGNGACVERLNQDDAKEGKGSVDDLHVRKVQQLPSETGKLGSNVGIGSEESGNVLKIVEKAI